MRVGEGHVDAGEACRGLDLQEDGPGVAPERDVGVGLADGDGPVAEQLLAREDRRALDQDIAGPREVEATVDENLPAIGGDDLVGVAPELDAIQGVARAVVGGCGDRLGQGVEQAARKFRPRPRRFGERGQGAQRRREPRRRRSQPRQRSEKMPASAAAAGPARSVSR